MLTPVGTRSDEARAANKAKFRRTVGLIRSQYRANSVSDVVAAARLAARSVESSTLGPVTEEGDRDDNSDAKT